MPNATSDLSAFEHDGKIYILGGRARALGPWHPNLRLVPENPSLSGKVVPENPVPRKEQFSYQNMEEPCASESGVGDLMPRFAKVSLPIKPGYNADYSVASTQMMTYDPVNEVFAASYPLTQGRGDAAAAIANGAQQLQAIAARAITASHTPAVTCEANYELECQHRNAGLMEIEAGLRSEDVGSAA
eukprot:Skav209045  [mRNA]  locus=scaffold2483:138151:140938:+ [translate_table: standard]